MKLVLGFVFTSVLPNSLCLKCFTKSNTTQQNVTDELTITEVNEDQCCGMSIQEPCEPKSLMFHAIVPDPEIQKSKKFFCAAEPTATCCCMEDLCNGNLTSFMKMWNETAISKESTNQSQCVLQAFAALQQNISEISSEIRRESTTEPPPDGTVFPIRERPTKQMEEDTVQKPVEAQSTKRDKALVIYLSLAAGLLLLCVIVVCCATFLRKRRRKRRRPKVPKFARKSKESAESKNGPSKTARAKKRRASSESRSKETRGSKESKEKFSNEGKQDSEYFGIPQAQQEGGSVESQMQAPSAEGESIYVPGARGGKG